MARIIETALTLALATSIVCAQEADLEKAVLAATKAGDLAKAKQLCDQWAEKKPDDERPYLLLGRLYVKLEMYEKAIEPFEMAREVNPLNPEPMCELGKIFLLAGMAEEAIAEFQAALEVRKDYAPARKGLAEARGLRDNPYPNGVRITLGASNEERGLRLWDKRSPSRVVTIGGRECRATDKARHVLRLDLDVSDEYLHEVDLPVRVTVEYYDVGTDRLGMHYDSTDFTAYRGGASKVTENVTKTNTKTWNKYTFNLPDARFSTKDGQDLVLWCDSWRRQEDLYVSSVHVVQGGLQARAEPKAATVGGVSSCAVTAKVLDANGPVPDGTPVQFATDRGTVTAKVETVEGMAEATFTSGDEPGEANVTVSTEHDKRVVNIPVLRGVGKIVRRRLLVHPFGGKKKWKIHGTAGTELIVEPAPDRGREGRPATRVVYKLRQEDRRSMVSMVRSIPLSGRAVKLGLWVHLDGTPNSIHLQLKDATGQTHGYLLGYMKATGWKRMEQVIGAALNHRGGANDGRLHYPLRFQQLTFRRYYGGGQRPCEGEVHLQDLTVETDIPSSETLELTITPAEPSSTFRLDKPPVFRARIGNLLAEPRSVRLKWTVEDGEGQKVAEGQTEEIDVGPETRVLTGLPLNLTIPGLYQATFAFEDDDLPDARSEARTFLLLNDSTDHGLPAELRPVAEGVDVCVGSQLKEAAQLSLSYQVLNDQREIARKGALGQPNMTLEAGETLECRLKLDGLEPDRYSILLLLDRADGERLTALLPHQVFPDRATVGARVLGDDKPLSGASIRARLVRRPLRQSSMDDRTIESWDVQTDEEGKFALPELETPPDVERCRVHLGVVAGGYVDLHRTYSLSGLLPSRGRPARKVTLRLRRGEKLTGRVIGTDGKPVAGARVEALSTVFAGGRVQRARRSYYYRPRQTDADGRFVLSIPPEARTELTIHTSRWAAKRVKVPEGQSDAGDIRLEPGTRVSGVLLDEHGKPAAGYWIAAQGSPGQPPMMWNPVRVAAKTDADGRFTLPPLLGEFRIWVPASTEPWFSEARQHSPSPRLAVLPQEHAFDGTQEQMELELRALPQLQVGGRVTERDGSPARHVVVYFYCNAPAGGTKPFDMAQTDSNGRFSFQGIPAGLQDIMVAVPMLRRSKEGGRTYLRAHPLPHVKGADNNGFVRLERIKEALPNIDFQFVLWDARKRFLVDQPKKASGASGRFEGEKK